MTATCNSERIEARKNIMVVFDTSDNANAGVAYLTKLVTKDYRGRLFSVVPEISPLNFRIKEREVNDAAF